MPCLQLEPFKLNYHLFQSNLFILTIEQLKDIQKYSIHAHFEGADDFLSGVHAFLDEQPLTLGSSTNQIWNSAFGGVTRNDINDIIIQQIPAVAYDSDIAIGSDSDAPGSVQYLAIEPSTVFQDQLHVSGTEDEFDTNLIIED